MVHMWRSSMFVESFLTLQRALRHKTKKWYCVRECYPKWSLFQLSIHVILLNSARFFVGWNSMACQSSLRPPSRWTNYPGTSWHWKKTLQWRSVRRHQMRQQTVKMKSGAAKAQLVGIANACAFKFRWIEDPSMRGAVGFQAHSSARCPRFVSGKHLSVWSPCDPRNKLGLTCPWNTGCFIDIFIMV